MRFITRTILIVLLFVALLAAAALSAYAQDGGQLSEEEQALLDRIFTARDIQDAYTSYQEEATKLYTRDTVLEYQGQTQTQQQVSDLTRNAIYTQDVGERDFLATVTDIETATESQGGQNEVTEFTVTAEARYVDGTLYVNATYAAEPEQELSGLPEGWVMVDDPAADEIYALLELDSLVEDNPAFEDEELVRATATSVTLAQETGADGVPVDVITVRFDGPESVLALMSGSAEGLDPTVETIVNAASQVEMSLVAHLDADDNPLEATSTMLIVAEDMDGQTLAPDRLPEGVVLDVRFDLQQSQVFSAANEPVDPITAPEELAE